MRKETESLDKGLSSKRTFLKYIIPTVLAFALSGVYAIVDGYFIGNSVGDLGLAAINIAWPVEALFIALGTGIGMGGAVMYAISRAQGKRFEASEYSGLTVFLLLLSAAASVAVLLPLSEPVIGFLGARGNLIDIGMPYMTVIIIGCAAQIFGTGLVPLVRNNGGASFAMIIMIMGFGINIVLDWVFIWNMGMGLAGAALATVIGQTSTAVGGFAFLIRKKVRLFSVSLRNTRAARILQIGLSAFGLTLCPNISIILMNRFLVSYSTVSAVAAYAVISYLAAIAYLLLQGVGDGAQPLFSDCYGRNAVRDLKKYRFMAYFAALVIAAACVIVFWLTRSGLGPMFGASREVSGKVASYMPLISIGFIFMALSRVIAAYLYATKDALRSSVIVYSEVIFLFIFLVASAPAYGETAIWICTPASQAASLILAVIFMLTQKKKKTA